MSSEWHALVRQKLFLATQLLRLSASSSQATEREACLQGAIELALRGRQTMLALIARCYQQKQGNPESLEALQALVGEIPELEQLTELSRVPGSWWQHLDQLEAELNAPPRQKKAVSADNIIAVSAAPGADRSEAALQRTLSGLKDFLDTLGERHSEW